VFQPPVVTNHRKEGKRKMIEWRLHIKMAEKRWRIADLERASGVSRETIRKLYYGKVDAIRMDTLDAICRALNCQVGDLMVYVPSQDEGGAS
ncbi:MAG: helix-turn-helix transcriptional regulator, partial [Clostridia bacterium]